MDKGSEETEVIYGNNPKELAMDRKNWINRNKAKWSASIKPQSTIFNWTKTSSKFKVEKVIDMYEVDSFRKSNTKFDKWKLWKYIKDNVIKRSIVKSQMKLFIESETGKVIKKYKQCWYQDKIMNTVDDSRVSTIKRMRIGNSKLNYHKNR